MYRESAEAAKIGHAEYVVMVKLKTDWLQNLKCKMLNINISQQKQVSLYFIDGVPKTFQCNKGAVGEPYFLTLRYI